MSHNDGKRSAMKGTGISPYKGTRVRVDGRAVALSSMDDEVEVEMIRGSEAAPTWFTAFERRMTTRLSKMSRKMDEVKEIAEQARFDAHEALAAATEAQDGAAALQDEVESLKAHMVNKVDLQTSICEAINDGLEDKIRKILADLPQPSPPTKLYEEGARELQIVVGGFDEDTQGQTIIDTIEKFMKEAGARNKVESVGTFVDPARVRFIEFESKAAKISFFRKIRNASTNVNGLDLWFTSNRTFAERARDKCLGLVKHNLIEIQGQVPSVVKIDWERGFVKVKNKKVATVSEEAEVACSPEAADIKDAVEAGMAAWFAKRE